ALSPQPAAGNATPVEPARSGPAAGRRVHSVFVRARSSTRTVLGPAVLLLVALSGCAGLPSEPIPGAPAHHVRGGYRNTAADFHRASGWTRFKFLVSRSWQSLVSPRTFDTPRESAAGLAGGQTLLAGAAPTITWIGHASLLVRFDGVTV